MDRTIETPLGKIHAHVEGSGPAILLAHGYHPDSTGAVWENNVAALAGAGYTVYALDLIGYGQSGGTRLDYEQQAQALVHLMDAEGIESAVVGGVSWGGMVALEVAMTAPERVARLILVASAGAGQIAEEKLERIDCPVLVVWGEDDAVIPVVNAAWFGAVLPNARVEMISGVTEQEGVPSWGGHHPMRYKPEEFNRVAVEFLRSGTRGQASTRKVKELPPRRQGR